MVSLVAEVGFQTEQNGAGKESKCERPREQAERAEGEQSNASTLLSLSVPSSPPITLKQHPTIATVHHRHPSRSRARTHLSSPASPPPRPSPSSPRPRPYPSPSSSACAAPAPMLSPRSRSSSPVRPPPASTPRSSARASCRPRAHACGPWARRVRRTGAGARCLDPSARRSWWNETGAGAQGVGGHWKEEGGRGVTLETRRTRTGTGRRDVPVEPRVRAMASECGWTFGCAGIVRCVANVGHANLWSTGAVGDNLREHQSSTSLELRVAAMQAARWLQNAGAGTRC